MEALIVLLILAVFYFAGRMEREERRSHMNDVDREMDDLNPTGLSS